MTERSRLESRLAERQFVITAEITPPLSADADALLVKAEPLRGKVDAINVTDGAGARVAMSSLSAATLLVQAGLEPVLQVTCRDRNRIGLAADLIGAAALGMRNLLILHGDSPERGELPDAKGVFDLDSRGLMTMVKAMRDEGTIPSGRAIEPPPHLFIGAADVPNDPAPDWEPKSLAAKAEAGADFVQTQFCFDPAVAGRYLARLAEFGLTDKLKVIIGVGPLASARSARWMNDNLFGVTVPDETIARLEGAEDQAAEGRRICVELIQALRAVPHVAGVHIMAPLQGSEAIAAVIEEAG